MKKLFVLMGMTLGLTGPVAAQIDNTWPTPQPLADYMYRMNYSALTDFLDLGTPGLVDEDGIVTDNAQMKYGLMTLLPFGQDIATGTELNNLFFGFDEGEWKAVAKTDDATKATAYPLASLTQGESLTFMEKEVTGLLISALGGIYFTDETGDENGIVEMTLPAPDATLADMNVPYMARALVTGNDDAGLTLTAKKIADMPVGYIGVSKDFTTGLNFALVQFNLQINNDTLIYQIKFADDGRVEYRIGKQQISNGTSYRFGIDQKRDTETLAFGGPSAYSIYPSPTYTYWTCFSESNLNKSYISIWPRGGVINGTPNYTSITATMVLNDKSKSMFEGHATDIVVLLSEQQNPTPGFENQAYEVGDYVKNPQDFRSKGYRVVYHADKNVVNHSDVIPFNVTGLTPNKAYYLYAYVHTVDGSGSNTTHLYTTTPWVFSAKLKTSPMETPANVTTGEPEGNHIPLSFDATVFKTLVVKSAYALSNEPTGTLNVGSELTYGTVVAILDKNATSCNIEMTPGEMTYVQMYAIDDNAENPGYSDNFTLIPLYRQATALPLSYTFGDPDYIDDQPQNAMPILPPGISTSTTDLNLKDFAFYAYPPMFFGDRTVYLTSLFEKGMTSWPNVIMPAFSGAPKVQATFYVRFYQRGRLDFETADASGMTVRIEYSLNGGEWREAGLFSGDNFPENLAGVYPLSVSFDCAPTDTVRLRYSYTASNTIETAIETSIVSYEFVDASDCEMPTNLKVESEKTTDKSVVLTWKDNNTPAANQYLVSYQKYVAPVPDNEEDERLSLAETDGETDIWETLTVNTPRATLRHLEANTTYNIKVQAVCTSGTSLASPQVQASVPAGMPYIENMVFDDLDRATGTYAIKPTVTVYKGEPGIEWEEVDFMNMSIGEQPDSWNAMQCEAVNYGENPDGLAVSTAQEEAILATPTVFVHKYVTPLPKTLTFRVNTYATNEEGDLVNGVDLLDPNLRLYVLASINGTFSWDDTVASFDHNALKATAAAPADEDYAERGLDLSVNMDKFEGLVRIAFYFHNPNPFDYYAPENDDQTPMLLEILGISLNYDGEVPCFPVEALKASDIDETVATLTWEGEGEEYGITYYPAADKSKAKTIYQEATEADLQTIKLEGLTDCTEYIAEVISYCSKGDRENGSIPMSVEFETLRALFSVMVDITPKEAGTIHGAGSYFGGDIVTLTATANEGYKFVAWKDGETELSKETTYTFDMPGRNIAYTAMFTKSEMFSVTVNITPERAGTVKGAGDYFEGDDVTLTATANKGYKFIVWKDGETELSKDAAYTFVMPTGDVAYTAVFEEETGNEGMIRADFRVSTDNGRLIVRNLNGLTIKDIDIFGLNANRINRFAVNSREDLILPIDAERTLVLVRLNTEKGVAVYKVYVH